MAYRRHRPNDWYFLVDIDEVAIKMTLLNMLLHGMRGVVCYGNTLTRACYECWVVTPDLFSYGGVPYIVPCGTDIHLALGYLPSNDVISAPIVDQEENVEVKDNSLDAWLK